jgi:hypothetical protein
MTDGYCQVTDGIFQSTSAICQEDFVKNHDNFDLRQAILAFVAPQTAKVSVWPVFDRLALQFFPISASFFGSSL